MKISLKWLNEFVDVSEFFAKPNELSDILTRAGFEVEAMANRALDFNNVVVGYIKTKDKHPNADKLSLCQVEVASGIITQIVCGAQNHKAGDKVIVALSGAVLPGNFVIKKSKIRDVESNGMLCSYKELGLPGESDGIVILDAEAVTGKNFAEHAGYDDISFELKVTPNRADCLSHYGLARELGCLLNKKVNKPKVLTDFFTESTKSKIKLEILNTELCPRYCGRFIMNVNIGPSPKWLTERLESVGMNSINNVVDVTNYVMLEMGQPLHAFDADLISGSHISVRSANKNEKFKTLKEQEFILTGEELVICDAEKPVALAGVIGGLNSGVSDKTKNIFLESASFNAMSVRKSSRMHGVETDSAYRFSRGVDPSSTLTILDRAAYLILQVAGGMAFTDAYDINSGAVAKKPIQISIKTVSERLGYEADEQLFLTFMRGLQIEVAGPNNGVYTLTPPIFRFDIEQDMDLVEEYARLHGYENIQEKIPALSSEPSVHNLDYILNQKISATLRSLGFNQAFNYAFTNETTENKWLQNLENYKNQGLVANDVAIKIKNPLSEDINIMRRTLSLGLWQNALNNMRSGNEASSLFETGAVFLKKDNEYIENKRLSLITWGTATGIYASATPAVFNIKSAIEKLLQSLQITTYSFVSGGNPPAFLHLGQWAQVIVQGEAVGFVGSMHPRLLSEEKIRFPVAIAELNLEALLKGQPRPTKFKSLSKFANAERDFAFVMDSEKAIGDLLKEAKKSCGATLKEINVFDIYEGDKLQAGQKSVAIRASFQSGEVAISEVEIAQLSQKIVDAAKKSVNAALR